MLMVHAAFAAVDEGAARDFLELAHEVPHLLGQVALLVPGGDGEEAFGVLVTAVQAKELLGEDNLLHVLEPHAEAVGPRIPGGDTRPGGTEVRASHGSKYTPKSLLSSMLLRRALSHKAPVHKPRVWIHARGFALTSRGGGGIHATA